MNHSFFFLTLFGLTMTAPVEKSTETASQPVVVLELFTSQGCSSCPPADKALQEITEQASRSGKAVYSVSFHVDYWDRLGWRDPFSSKQFTDRQRQYDRILHAQTYTPQLVINGRQDIIGSQKGRIEQAIQTIQKQPASTFIGVDGKVAHAGNQLTVSYTLSSAGPYRVNAALVQKEARTDVKNGENGGRTLTNTNVVRQFKTVDESDTSGSLILSLPAGLTADQTAVLLYIQRTDNQQIVGAKQLLD